MQRVWFCTLSDVVFRNLVLFDFPLSKKGNVNGNVAYIFIDQRCITIDSYWVLHGYFYNWFYYFKQSEIIY
jgi:hypothetical protein